MIGMLRGTLTERCLPDILIEVQGVGYEVQVPLNTLATLGEIGSNVKLYTHFVVREDAQQLYGFIDKTSRSLFRSLIKVNGVGPKLAMAILSSMDVKHFVQAVQQHDSQALVRVPGVGKKTAERLVIEMSDRLKEWETAVDMPFELQSADNLPSDVQGQQLQEAESALVSLGYKPAQATKTLNQIKQQANSTEELIRLALKQFAMV